jgi:hypothetical protein
MANERKEKADGLELELHDTHNTIRGQQQQRNALVLPPTQPLNPRLGKKAVKGPILLYVSFP